MKYLAALVCLVFMVVGAFVPPPLHDEVGIHVEALQKIPPLDIKVQSQARAEYTISWYQDYVITHESGWHVNSVNASSGACGLAQALPCSKMPCKLTKADFDCQMAWANKYAQERYGGWKQSYEWWAAHRWW